MKVLTVTNMPERCDKLVASLKTFGWDYEVIVGPWKGFGSKMHGIYSYLMDNPDVKDFIFTDGFDTLAIRNADEFVPLYPNYVSAEKNYYTGDDNYVDLVDKFSGDTKFIYPNAGQFYMQRDFFIQMFESDPLPEDGQDQGWLINQCVKYGIPLDTHCLSFQTIYQTRRVEFDLIDGKLVNMNTKSFPFFIHGNGQSAIGDYYSMFKAGRPYLVKTPKITVCVPTMGSMRDKTVMSLIDAVIYTIQCGYLVEIAFKTDTYLIRSRNELVQIAISNGSDYMMFIDSDLEFPADGIVRLLAHEKDVIGGYYNKRGLPKASTVLGFDQQPYFPQGLEKVWCVPTGFMLIRLEAIRWMPYPFDYIRDEKGYFIGEDVNFCKRFNEMGGEVWCDSTIEIGHIGDFVY